MRKWMLLSLAAALLLVTALVVTRSHRRSPAGTVADATAANPASAPSSGFLAPRATVELPRDAAGLEKVFAGLAEAGGDQKLEGAMADAYFALLKALRKDPAMLAAVEEMLRTADRHAPETRVAVGALIAVGTPEAQDALIRLTDVHKGDVEFLELLVPSMGFVERPTQALEGALHALTTDVRPDIRSMADLSMGVVAATLDVTDPARARRIVDQYGAKLTASANPAELHAALSVLGNAGTLDAARLIQPYTSDERPDVRADAVEALRRIPTRDAEAALLAAAGHDGDRDVRNRAVLAMSMRPATDTSVRSQIAMLATETDENIARGLLSNIWSGIDVDHDLVVATLTQTAASHPLTSVQEQARAMLKGMAKT
jgi:hypothetical protein